jgi:hypothetical protein
MTKDLTTTFEKLAALRAKYPDELERIQADEERLSKLMLAEELYSHPVMKDLLAVCHRDVLMARKKLATDRTLIENPDAQDELWKIIDARLWFVQRASQNYQAELAAMDVELEQLLQAAS